MQGLSQHQGSLATVARRGRRPLRVLAAAGKPAASSADVKAARLARILRQYDNADLEKQQLELQEYEEQRAAAAADVEADGSEAARARARSTLRPSATTRAKSIPEVDEKMSKFFITDPETGQVEPNLGAHADGKSVWWALWVKPSREKQVIEAMTRMAAELEPLVDAKTGLQKERVLDWWLPSKSIKAWSPKSEKMGNKALRYPATHIGVLQGEENGGWLFLRTILDRPLAQLLLSNNSVSGFRLKERFAGETFPLPCSVELLDEVHAWEEDLTPVKEQAVREAMGTLKVELPEWQVEQEEREERRAARFEERGGRGGRFGERGGRGGRGRGGRFEERSYSGGRGGQYSGDRQTSGGRGGQYDRGTAGASDWYQGSAAPAAAQSGWFEPGSGSWGSDDDDARQQRRGPPSGLFSADEGEWCARPAGGRGRGRGRDRDAFGGRGRGGRDRGSFEERAPRSRPEATEGGGWFDGGSAADSASSGSWLGDKGASSGGWLDGGVAAAAAPAADGFGSGAVPDTGGFGSWLDDTAGDFSFGGNSVGEAPEPAPAATPAAAEVPTVSWGSGGSFDEGEAPRQQPVAAPAAEAQQEPAPAVDAAGIWGSAGGSGGWLDAPLPAAAAGANSGEAPLDSWWDAGSTQGGSAQQGEWGGGAQRAAPREQRGNESRPRGDRAPARRSDDGGWRSQAPWEEWGGGGRGQRGADSWGGGERAQRGGDSWGGGGQGQDRSPSRQQEGGSWGGGGGEEDGRRDQDRSPADLSWWDAPDSSPEQPPAARAPASAPAPADEWSWGDKTEFAGVYTGSLEPGSGSTSPGRPDRVDWRSGERGGRSPRSDDRRDPRGGPGRGGSFGDRQEERGGRGGGGGDRWGERAPQQGREQYQQGREQYQPEGGWYGRGEPAAPAEQVAAAASFKEGAPVVVTGGAFQDFEGKVLSTERGRVTAELDIFGKKTKVDLNPSDISPATPAQE